MSARLLLICVVLTFPATASGRVAGWPVPPSAWLREASCIHGHEVYGHVGRWDEWSVSNGAGNANGFQFALSTWVSVGGTVGTWRTASPAEQRYRAWLLWNRNGHSWRHGQWPNTAVACGVN